MELRVNLRRDEGIAVIAFAGDVDVYTAPVLRDAISKVLAAGDKAMVVDMSEVSFLDSTGLGVLVGRLKAVRMLEGVMRVVITNPRVLRNFQITGLEKIFTIDSTAADAVAAVKAGA